ncbi:MAG: hypothetical protein B6D65_00525 [candidate division Zixibacteria bacterium 4484_93]|nr:MAG: hypothetical protein B6D65_00525 [candidate division Zixibacteria bacterium 4484_93]
MKRLSLAILWHMHQPYYYLDAEERFLLPWARLHALKDYYDMPYIVSHFPDVHVSFNLVPALLEQLELYISGKTDYCQEIASRPVDELSNEDKLFLLKNFFFIEFEHNIRVSPRYLELYRKRGKGSSKEYLKEKLHFFTLQEYLDIVVHFLLAWSGNSIQEDEFVHSLVDQDSYYTEEQKQHLLHIQSEHIKKIIPLYRRMWEDGQIELTASPYFHPILPLLCDTNIAKVCQPHSPLPDRQFSHPEDAKRQVAESIGYFEDRFGKRPSGFWPSEGSVSEAALRILAESGISFCITDEGILRRSLALTRGTATRIWSPGQLYQPYSIYRGGRLFHIFFRDRKLSDKIGFEYANLPADVAVSDFIFHLEGIYNSLPDDGKEYIVSVVLDGENAWEYFDRNGLDFLTRLYETLSSHPVIRTTTFSDYLSRNSEFPILERLYPGSWISSDFHIWIGDEIKNRAWDYLADAVEAVNSSGNKNPDATRSLLVAEGSDWFWWYGAPNYTQFMSEFDYLFRANLSAAYKKAHLALPEHLCFPVMKKSILLKPTRPPLELISPTLDGLATSFFEWSPAGFYQLSSFSTRLARGAKPIVRKLYFGFDDNYFYIRLDLHQKLNRMSDEVDGLRLVFEEPVHCEIVLTIEPLGQEPVITVKGDVSASDKDVLAKAVELVELAVSRELIGGSPGDRILYYIEMLDKGEVIERFPPGGKLLAVLPSADYNDEMWFV